MVRPHVTGRPVPIVVAGPTAAGKSALALELSQRLGGEVVCADSRQVYVGMAVAAAGATPQERAEVPHHLEASIDPRARYTAADFVRDADRLVVDIQARGRVPILVGGTGMWLRAWRTGLDADLPADPAVRAALQQRLRTDGLPALVTELAERDPDAAAAIDVRNPVRVVRALEIAHLGGQRGARHMADVLARPARFPARWLLLTASLDQLTPRIARRAAAMFGHSDASDADAAATPPNPKIPAINAST